MAWWMKRRVAWWWALAFVLGLMAWPAALAQEGGQRPDVRVVLDVSGSMKHNDPDRLSASALELLVSLLPRGADAGVWTFGERVDNPLPLGEVDAAWRDRALALAPVLEEYQQYTDIEAALREATRAGGSGRRHLVLLTDGMVDLPDAGGGKSARDAESRRRLVEELAPALFDQGVAVHAVAFSGQADLALVERLSQATGGLAARVETPGSLLGAFLDIFERIFPADQVPLQAGRFVIDPDVESFTALLFHEPDGEPITLIAPDGTRHRFAAGSDELLWQVEPRFDLIRMPDPQPGEWRVEGRIGGESRINVLSPRTLRTGDLPATLYLGFGLPVTAWIERDGTPSVAAHEGLSVSVELQDPQGRVQAGVTLHPEGGRFVGELPAPALVGNARLVIRAEGHDFHRQRIQAVNVLPAIGAVHRPADRRVVLAAEHPRLDRDNTEIVGELQGETLKAEAVESTRWHLSLPEREPRLRVPLLLTARVTLDGVTREVRLPRLLLNPGADTGLDLAGPAGPTLSAERLADEADERPGRPVAGADGFVERMHALPRRAIELWEQGRPELERLTRLDPWRWAGGGLVLLLVVLAMVGMRRRRHARRGVRREEPHV